MPQARSAAPAPKKPKLALSIRQPWAWLIVNGWKDVENRNWPTEFRGRVLVHAGKTMTRDDYEEAKDFALEIDPTIQFPHIDALERGGFVGEVDITGCVKESASDWFVGDYGFTLANAIATPFQAYRGQLGFFAVKEAA